MEKNSKKENKLCFILYLITSILFLVSGIINLVDEGLNNMTGISNMALSVTFASLSIIYYIKYRKE